MTLAKPAEPEHLLEVGFAVRGNTVGLGNIHRKYLCDLTKNLCIRATRKVELPAMCLSEWKDAFYLHGDASR